MLDKSKRLYINSGANQIKLKSGDLGFYVDICLEQLDEIVKENPEVIRKWHQRSSGKDLSNVRVFVKPNDGGSKLYSYYLEVVPPKDQPKES